VDCAQRFGWIGVFVDVCKRACAVGGATCADDACADDACANDACANATCADDARANDARANATRANDTEPRGYAGDEL
jgi:hypothetical protein